MIYAYVLSLSHHSRNKNPKREAAEMNLLTRKREANPFMIFDKGLAMKAGIGSKTLKKS